MTQTIGQRLKAEREEQHLTLEKVFEATRIRVQYLQALEADDLSVMPSPVQARGYLRNYAEYLGLDVEQVLNELRAANAQPVHTEVIGPADEPPSIPPQDNKPLETPPTIPAVDVSGVVEEPPAPAEVPATSPSVTIPIKPKSSRRKKENGSTSQPQTATDAPQGTYVEPPTRRRSRKKADPETDAVPGVEPPSTVAGSGASATALETASPVEIVPQPQRTEETLPPIEVIAEPVAEESPVQPEVPQPADARDKRWLAWLNKVRSASPARKKRQPPAQPQIEPTVAENELEPVAIPAEPDVPEMDAQDRPLESSNQILKEIGHELCERRELLSLHLDEVERNTHVKAHYLSALERGALDELPSTVQTRGMLSNYATFLDLDVDALLLRFADALQARHRERNPQKSPRKSGQPIVANVPPIRSFLAGDMIFGVGMAILVVGFVIWGVSRVMTIQSQRDAKPTAPSISDVLLSSPNPSSFSTATPTFLPVEAFPGEATVTVEVPTQNANARVQLNLVAVERTYLRVVVDGKSSFDGRVVPGNAYPFEAENQIEVLVGSGAAIRLVYNGRDMGLMGTFGQVVHNVYTSTEIITPTALPTETPTITPTATNTVRPTATSRFTVTPVRSATPVP